MDIFSLYSDVVEDEIKFSDVTEERIKKSWAVIKSAYSPVALKNGNTFLDYNIPSHRCAYLLKFGPNHTELIYIYFHTFLANVREAYSALKQRNELNICCLGGGAGTDVVGIVRALVSFKCLQKKISSVTVLDICGGWRNSFKRIMQKLKERQDVSDAFLDKENLCAKLVSVDLTQTLSDSTINIVGSADIICMVKFVSAVRSRPSFDTAFKNLANYMKPGAVVIFIDNLHNKVYEPVNNIFIQSGFDCVFGPHHVSFRLKGNYPLKLHFFGRSDLMRSTAVSVLGWIKNSPSAVPCTDEKFISASEDILCTDGTNGEDEDWKSFENVNDTMHGQCVPIEGNGDEDDFFSNEDSLSGTDEASSYSDQSTQTTECSDTSSQYVHKPCFNHLENQLSLLASRLSHLEYLVKNLETSNKCCSNIETPHTSGASSSDRLQCNINNSFSTNKGSVNSNVFASSLQNGDQCQHHKSDDVHGAPFLVLPVSRQCALQTVLLSGYNTR